MSKDQEGRRAGHHCTPGQGWRWQSFGPRTMLVTNGGGADLVLSVRDKGKGHIELITCGPDGLIVPVTPDSPMGKLLAGIGDLVDAALLAHDQNDRPRYLPMLHDALRACGVI